MEKDPCQDFKQKQNRLKLKESVMSENKFKGFGNTVKCIALILFVLSSFSFAAISQEVDVEKKYAEIIGNWELELTDAGLGILPVEFYVENGTIWVIPGDDPPLEMVLLEGEDWKFLVDDGDSVWGIEFVKDDNGKYHTCKVTNEFQGINTTGKKIKE